MIQLFHYANHPTSHKKKLMVQKTHSCHQMTITKNTITQITLYSVHFARKQWSAQPQWRSFVILAQANSLSCKFLYGKIIHRRSIPKAVRDFQMPATPPTKCNKPSAHLPTVDRQRTRIEGKAGVKKFWCFAGNISTAWWKHRMNSDKESYFALSCFYINSDFRSPQRAVLIEALRPILLRTLMFIQIKPGKNVRSMATQLSK